MGCCKPKEERLWRAALSACHHHMKQRVPHSVRDDTNIVIPCGARGSLVDCANSAGAAMSVQRAAWASTLREFSVAASTTMFFIAFCSLSKARTSI